MAMDVFKNLAYGVVLLPPTPPNLGSSLTLASGHGGRFGAPPFNISIWPFGVPADPTNTEIARCTAKSGDVLTLTRAQEGSQARTILNGDQVAQALTKKSLDDLIADLKAYTDSKVAALNTYVDTRDNDVYNGALGYTNQQIYNNRAPRLYSIASVAAIAPEFDNYEITNVYAQAGPLAINNPIGIAKDGYPLIIRLRDDGNAPRAITWSAGYMTACGVPLPTTTVQWHTIHMGFRLNMLYGTWQMIAFVRE